MTTVDSKATALIALAVAGATAFSGCSMGSNPSGTGGNPMMGGSGYTYSSTSCAAPSGLPGTTVRVTLADMGMTRMMGGVAPMGAHMRLLTSASTVPTGTVTLVATNVGWRTHELVVLPLATGAPAGSRVPGSDGKVDETGSLGEASSSCAGGSGDGIRAGTTGWVTLTLPRGRYELVCNLQNHYADGMYQEIDVT